MIWQNEVGLILVSVSALMFFMVLVWGVATDRKKSAPGLNPQAEINESIFGLLNIQKKMIEELDVAVSHKIYALDQDVAVAKAKAETAETLAHRANMALLKPPKKLSPKQVNKKVVANIKRKIKELR